MTDKTRQTFQLVRRWDGDSWPFEMNVEELDRLNRVARPDNEYHMSSIDGEVAVELYEYVGEYDAAGWDV